MTAAACQRRSSPPGACTRALANAICACAGLKGLACLSPGRLVYAGFRCVHHGARQTDDALNPREGTTMTRMIRMQVRQVVLAAALMALVSAPAAFADLAVQHDSTVVTETAGNGNGIPEPGDTLAVTENVVSVDPEQAFTGVTGSLSTTLAGATVGSASSAYPDLLFAQPTGNASPFSVA